MGLVVGIDASRLRSGGAVAHLLGILREGTPTAHGVSRVHVWTYKELADALPAAGWLTKHSPPELSRSLLRQLWWQSRTLPKEARETGCSVLFTADASTVCRYRPSVVLSQDMLSYEPGVMQHYGRSLARLRLITIGLLQTRAMREADGVVFLTKYARDVIQRTTGRLPRVAIIPHGIDDVFKHLPTKETWSDPSDKMIRCLYVSNAAMYKHQWVVVRAFGELRRRGHAVRLVLVGGGTGKARTLMEEAIAATDPQREFIENREFVAHDEIPRLLASADLFVFASSCENMPVTLMEAMAAGLPIASSDRGPMPEVLQDGGVYFDPENAVSIAAAVERIVCDQPLRASIAARARQLSEQYTWARCSNELWEFIRAAARAA